MTSSGPSQSLSIVEATVADLAKALDQGRVNSVELTAKHLLRVAKYDRRSLFWNAIPVINERAFHAAQASDDRRAAGKCRGLLDGIPCTIKDSYKMQGMTVAAGSPAFQNLLAREDAFTVHRIREAGGVVIGRTNMPPMAAGGMQRGVYGRAESPYNAEYLTAGFASGSSNGSGTSTAASMAVFGMGEETISSGRSPASNNGLVAYTPSRGLLSLRGNWPLFPTCDTVVPHTRTVAGMFALLDVIVAPDKETAGDFWRAQPFVALPSVEAVRPKSYLALADRQALAGAKLGVPKMYIGGTDSDKGTRLVHTRPSVVDLWKNAKAILENLGATVVEVDLPMVANCERPEPGAAPKDESLAPPYRHDVDMAQLTAHAWDDFLVTNKDASVADTLAVVDPARIFPQPPGTLPDKYGTDNPLDQYATVIAHISGGRLRSIYDIPGLGQALQTLENTRKTDWEDWLDGQKLDALVWPCNGDVGPSDADVDQDAAAIAWRNGVLYSNGNSAVRQLGVPTFNVPMGIMPDTGMPVNLTFAGRAYDDNTLLKYGYAFEQGSHMRQPPKRTPELATDALDAGASSGTMGTTAPYLMAEANDVTSPTGAKKVYISGQVRPEEVGELHVYVDGDELDCVVSADGSWSVESGILGTWKGRLEEKAVPSRDKAMVVIVATGQNGRSTGKMLFA